MEDQSDEGREFRQRPPTSALVAANARDTLQAHAGSARSRQHTLPAAQTASRKRRALHAQWQYAQQQLALQQAARIGFGRLPVTRRWWLSVGDVSSTGWRLWTAAADREQQLDLCWDGGWEKKNVILGFHGFYHGGPYSFIFFQLGRNVFNVFHLSPKTILGLKNPSFRPNWNLGLMD